MVIERRMMTQEENIVHILTWQILMLSTHNWTNGHSHNLMKTLSLSHDKLSRLPNSHYNRLTGYRQLVIETEKSLRKS